MSKRFVFFTAILITALLTLMLLLIHFTSRSVALREALFLDQVEVSVTEWADQMEKEYYCFDLQAEFDLPRMDSFYLARKPPFLTSEGERTDLFYQNSEGERESLKKISISSPVHLQMLLRFEFKDIPTMIPDDSLNDFEKYIRDSYDRYIWNAAGVRLIDTVEFDSLLYIAVHRVNQEAVLNYQVIVDEGEVIFENLSSGAAIIQPDVHVTLFGNDPLIPDLDLNIAIANKEALFQRSRWMNLLAGILLTLISVILILYLLRSYMQQKRMIKIQRDFVHGMTHEFNTPLANIRLIAQKLLKGSDEEVNVFAGILKEEGDKLQAGINMVLTTALVDRDELLLQKSRVSVNDILQKVVDRNRMALEKAGVQVTCHFETLPETELDSFHMENVFQNLITNVCKHSKAGHLRISSQAANDMVILNFADDGKGISEPLRKHIFRKFSSHSDNGEKNGYGLGLYYSRLIVEMHGGKIDLEATGTGSNFVIELPL